MNTLEMHGRPFVVFDPNDNQHRRWFAEFMEYNTWSRCPVRFAVPDDTGLDVPSMCKNLLLEYYLSTERLAHCKV